VLGIDGLLRTSPSSTIGYHAFGSQTEDNQPALPKTGRAVGVDYSLNNRRWEVGLTGLDISEGFRTEVGYMNRTGVSRARAFVGPKLYPSSGFIQRVEPSVVSEHTRDKFSGIWESFNWLQTRLVLPRSSSLTFRYHYSSEVFLGDEFQTSGVRLSGSTQATKELFFSLSYRRSGGIFYSETPYQGDGQSVIAALRFQPSEKIDAQVDYTFSNFSRRSDKERIYDYSITRGKFTYQFNRYLFFRAIGEYNAFHNEVLTDFLASFTYIPGTVIHFGYGSLYEKIEWRDGAYHPFPRFRESQRGLFFKASYLWRL
jgi:hypothetical protein